ncbi:MAG: hypothetical protein FRX48_07850 [Lasallia pustulata]|uniref:Uncharacterized protein n=1 Tax=Lasallia pustulata TaxID=136370 RepID=A0A5M8PFJ9_9LECA|nr:MAG: hypothetical protein FRX48_07850 [Lasallia pustulata]
MLERHELRGGSYCTTSQDGVLLHRWPVRYHRLIIERLEIRQMDPRRAIHRMPQSASIWRIVAYNVGIAHYLYQDKRIFLLSRDLSSGLHTARDP